MEDFLEAVAGSLRNMGLEAEASHSSIDVSGCHFHAHLYSRPRRLSFCNRSFSLRRGEFNVTGAVLAVLKELPTAIARRDAMLEAKDAADALRIHLSYRNSDSMSDEYISSFHAKKIDEGVYLACVEGTYYCLMKTKDLNFALTMGDQMQEWGR